MRKAVESFLGVLLLAGASFAAGRVRTFEGQIMDSECAKLGNHDLGFKMTGTSTPKDCTLACVKAGSKFVLYNDARKTIDQLDDQAKPREFAGQNVKVIGTYNSSTKTIHVEKIEAAK